MKTIYTGIAAAGLASVLMAQSEDALRQKKLEAAQDALKARATATAQTFEFVAGQLIAGPPVKGAPYSAEAVNETIQTLADGNRIVQRSSAMQYRDTEGRERREETSAMGVVFITDPVAATRYTLHPEAQTAEKGPLPSFSVTQSGGDALFFVHENAGLPGARSGGAAIAGRSVAGGGRGTVQAGTIRLNVNGESLTMITGQPVPGKTDSKTEQLGNMYIEGVQAQGSRTTTTIPAGDIGNDRPINIVDERWYSPDLQMTILTKHSDPRTGETSFALKNINRSNPPPTLFEVPSDYTVTAAGGRGGRSGGPGAPPPITLPRK